MGEYQEYNEWADFVNDNDKCKSEEEITVHIGDTFKVTDYYYNKTEYVNIKEQKDIDFINYCLYDKDNDNYIATKM